MNPREIESFMRESGFWPKRMTSTGVLWFDGSKYITVARRYTSPVSLKNLQADVKRIVRAREATAVQEGKIEMEPTKVITPQPQPLTQKLSISLPKPPEKLKIVEPEAVKKDRRTMRRFTAVQLHQIYRVIHLGNLGGRTIEQLAADLNAAGHRMSDGAPIEANYVTTALHNLRHPHWAERTQEWERLAAPQPVALPAVAPVAAPPAPSPSRSARQIPQWMLAFLTDPDLTAQEKIEMILAVGKA